MLVLGAWQCCMVSDNSTMLLTAYIQAVIMGEHKSSRKLRRQVRVGALCSKYGRRDHLLTRDPLNENCIGLQKVCSVKMADGACHTSF